MTQQLAEKLKIIPKKPGCYLWKNQQQDIIYIGKAKNLFNRTHSYFTQPHNTRTQKMVNEIHDIDFIVVNNENEALILEANLIKEKKPFYNVLLKESNQYPYIFLSDENPPRLFYTRNKIEKYKGKYFGPFAINKIQPYELFHLLKRVLPIQNCKHAWNKECFNCEILKLLKIDLDGVINPSYQHLKKMLTNIFNGEIEDLLNYLKKKENEATNNLQFEEAQRFLNLQNSLKNIVTSQYVQINQSTIDIIAIAANLDQLAIVIFSYVNGKLLIKNEKWIEYVSDYMETCCSYLYQYYQEYKKPKKIVFGFTNLAIKQLEKALEIEIIIPQKGQLFEVLQMAIKNALETLNKYNISNQLKKERTIIAQEELKKMLQLEKLNKIEIFDVSSFFGTQRVGAMVVYENALPQKKLYRKFIIKDENAISDLACLKEILLRRYARVLVEKQKLPDLIILDGGHAHLNLGERVLETLDLKNKIPIAVLAKNDKHQTNSIIFNNKQIILEQNNSFYFYLLNIQNEVHRYAISFFKRKNLQSQLSSFLRSVEGIGPKRFEQLMKKYENIYNLSQVSVPELSQILTAKIAIKLKEKLDKVYQKNQELNKNN